MKPQLNPDQLYKAALKLEQQALKEQEVQLKLKEPKPFDLAKVSRIITGIAAVFMLGWLIVNPRIEQHKMEKLQKKLAVNNTRTELINAQGTIKSVDRFNGCIKNITGSNETIQRFNKKVEKFNKSNT